MLPIRATHPLETGSQLTLTKLLLMLYIHKSCSQDTVRLEVLHLRPREHRLIAIFYRAHLIPHILDR
jgi:hypothetical protein